MHEGKKEYIFCPVHIVGKVYDLKCMKWIFNRNGQAAALDCGDSIYDRDGRFHLWIIGRNLYSMNGHHVGWAENGVYYDSNNLVIGFTRDHTGHLPYSPGYGGEPGMPFYLSARPALMAHSGEPGRPGYSGWSEILLEDYIKQ